MRTVQQTTSPNIAANNSLSKITRLVGFIEENAPLCVITGAGCTTDSGIFDYRDADGLWKRSPSVQFSEFRHSIGARRRYWARSMLGWPRFASARPNVTHHALVDLEREGLIGSVISQNVDDLHVRAGQRNLIELHGRLATVSCLECEATVDRAQVQTLLQRFNRRYWDTAIKRSDSSESEYTLPIEDSFWIPNCQECNGILKPDVVFFGESVPSGKVERAYEAVSNAHGMLILGSSVMVYSSYRFARYSHKLGLPIGAINKGRTRVDEWLELKLTESLAIVMKTVSNRMNLLR